MRGILAPAPAPCGSCPYRCDVPSGVWAPEEYDKLPKFDLPTGEQPPSVFLCHQQNGRLCAGWAACHDMSESLGLRVASLAGFISDETFEQVLDYTTSVPLFTSGAEAAAHGREEIEQPGERAARAIDKLRQHKRRTA